MPHRAVVAVLSQRPQLCVAFAWHLCLKDFRVYIHVTYGRTDTHIQALRAVLAG